MLSDQSSLPDRTAVEVPKVGVENLSSLPTNHGFLNAVVRFEDRSLWKIKKPLSERRHQEESAPFESSQVFTCECLEDPNDIHVGIQEAVMKVKYQ
jgi:hypothetical protein